MSSAYLQPSDYAAYGVTGASAAQVTQASALIDAYLARPEGLIWTPDATGMPGYMAALSPTYSLSAQGSIEPGLNVVVTLNGPVAALQVGDVLILDRANAQTCEAVVLASVSGQSVTIQQVNFSHAAGAMLDYGLVIEEQKYLPESRPITFTSRAPLLRVIAGVGRYAYGRRGDAANYSMDQFNLLAALSKFGGPPVWELFQPTNLSIDVQTGNLWIPAGVMLAYYSEIKIRYVAGYQYTTLPPAIKQACATLIQAIANTTQMGNTRAMKAGDTAVQRFSASLMDEDTKTSLNQFRARLFK